MALEIPILIVGAGISGLLAAQCAATAGSQVLVVDKSPSVGGRLATRRIGGGHADYGAQFFTVRDATFQSYVDSWLDQGLVYVWSTGWSDGSLATTPSDGYPRYAVRGGMNRLAQHVATLAEAAGAQIRLDARLVRVTQAGDGWHATDERGLEYHAQALVLTAPTPQALALLDNGNVALAPADRAALERIDYAPCLCGLFEIAGGIDLPAPGALQRPEAAISWIADNRRKGISPAATIMTVHAGPLFSREHDGDDDDTILALLGQALAPYLRSGATVAVAQLKRWRYSLPTVLYPERFLCAAGLPPLYFGGDAFGHPRVEGAALSGLAIGAALTAA